MPRKQTAKSFWLRVVKTDGCWEWQGSLNSTGYGTVSWHGTVYTAHRVAAWLSGLVELPSAPQYIKDVTYVLHKCDNRKCCNPEHFFLGSYTDNMIDAYRKKRKTQPKGEFHANAKLTNVQAEEIREAYDRGTKQVELSAMYGVSQRVISLIVRRESYL